MKCAVDRRRLALAAILILAAFPAAADLEVTTSVQIHAKADIEAPLAAHGAWVEVGSYGRCWRPAHMAVGWRPYGHGQWVWTDCGWYWSSNEPWAWACYHYGSWVYDPSWGWVWIPQTEWAPAWVSWRVGGGYIGWAPLGPPGWFLAREPKAELFVFVGEARFGSPLRPGLFLADNKAVFKSTSPLGGVKRESRSLGGPGAQKVMVNHGPSLDQVQKASGRTFTTVSIRDAANRTAGPSAKSRTVAQAPAPRNDNAPGANPDHGPDRTDSPGKDNVRSGPDHDLAAWRDPGNDNSRGSGSRSSGGGRGRH